MKKKHVAFITFASDLKFTVLFLLQDNLVDQLRDSNCESTNRSTGSSNLLVNSVKIDSRRNVSNYS